MIWLAFARKYAAVLAVAALVALLLYWLSSAIKKAEYRGYERARDDMAIEVAKANARTAALEQRQRNRIHEVENAHQKALSDLDARYAARSVPAVRLCREPALAGELPPNAAAATFDHGAAGPDGFPGGAAADIGPDLERLVRAADQQTQRLIACQAYASSLAK